MKSINGETILELLADAFEFVCDRWVEIGLSLAVLVAVSLFVGLIVHTDQQNSERNARRAYCYEQNYAEVMKSKYTPYYYCFDARRDADSQPIRSIPESVWKDTK